ncbi:hypothetical protein [Actinomadura sp. WMMB 499]|uniref:hypothetical protein n=1 Tax=Actinomadura sp. WMMB 499 TaxID=1219491 RepID=UPI001244B883|nr:hypothetical protein [Actinomadura sp. WMMB 499]QFG25436.1 hypothetical protein F7P10_34030 [Actinomadura sp. WMMB 499]
MDVMELWNQIERETAGMWRQMEIAEEEIRAVMEEHGEESPWDEDGNEVRLRGPIFDSFTLMHTGHRSEPMPEMVYRAHCREIAERRAKGEDTRPATAAEMLYPLSEASKVAPLAPSVAGLYLKLGLQCFPELMTDVMDDIGRSVGDYERIHGQEMAEHEAYLRKKLTQPWRTKD